MTVFVDIDHTLADAAWRDDLMGDWDAYHTRSAEDRCFPEMAALIRTLTNAGPVVGLTARPEKWRRLTLEWMCRSMIPVDELIMRPDNNYQPAHELKRDLLIARFGSVEHLARMRPIVIEDRDDCAAAFRSIGATVLQAFPAAIRDTARSGGPEPQQV